MLIRLLLASVLVALVACTSDLTPVVGTAIRTGKPVVEPGTELELRIFTTKGECLNAVAPALVDDCLPHVDRASGEVRFGIQYRLDTDVFPMPMLQDSLRVVHQGTEIQDGQSGQRYTLIPHEPIATPQLIILVLDVTTSMFNNNKLEKLRAALLLPEVKAAFFPEGVRSGVVLTQFTTGNPSPLGGTLRVIDDPKEYTSLVKKELRVLFGYTELYQAVNYSTGDLLQDPEIKRFIDLQQAAPTVIVLTDGYNDPRREYLCSTNAPDLTLLLKRLKKARNADDVDLRHRPQVFMVGLGRAVRKKFTLPDTIPDEISPELLCGKYKDLVIDGYLEDMGIDNASMDFIAATGGGFSFVKNSTEGLGEAFLAAAAKRYEWFEVRYRLDPFYLRRAFRTRLRLLSIASAESSVMVYPSAWLDAPPGVPGEDGWSRPQTFLHTAVVAVPAFSLLLFVGYFSAALFNTRRALFRSSRPKAPPRPRGAPPSP